MIDHCQNAGCFAYHRPFSSRTLPHGHEVEHSKSSIEWTALSWNSGVGCTKISLDCKNGYAETERGCGISKGLVTAASQEARAGRQKSPRMSGSGKSAATVGKSTRR
jgi:protein gp37